jgi:hypothetical protein
VLGREKAAMENHPILDANLLKKICVPPQLLGLKLQNQHHKSTNQPMLPIRSHHVVKLHHGTALALRLSLEATHQPSHGTRGRRCCRQVHSTVLTGRRLRRGDKGGRGHGAQGAGGHHKGCDGRHGWWKGQGSTGAFF